MPPEKGDSSTSSVRQHDGGDDSARAERRDPLGPLKKGQLVLLASVGAGFTVGAVLLRWGF
jgi:hypothetical protein